MLKTQLKMFQNSLDRRWIGSDWMHFWYGLDVTPSVHEFNVKQILQKYFQLLFNPELFYKFSIRIQNSSVHLVVSKPETRPTFSK